MTLSSADGYGPFFPPNEVDALLSVGKLRTVDAQRAVFRRGDAGDSLYVVLKGEIEIRFEEEKAPKRLGAGQVFGELALLAPLGLRTASA